MLGNLLAPAFLLVISAKASFREPTSVYSWPCSQWAVFIGSVFLTLQNVSIVCLSQAFIYLAHGFGGLFYSGQNYSFEKARLRKLRRRTSFSLLHRHVAVPRSDRRPEDDAADRLARVGALRYLVSYPLRSQILSSLFEPKPVSQSKIYIRET